MKNMIYIAALLPLMACSQSSYDKSQDTKINKAVNDISALKILAAAYKAKAVKDSTTQANQIKALKDTIALYKSTLSSGYFNVDPNRIITIPRLPLVEARVTKLEAKP